MIETEYRRTVALLARVTGRERLLDGAPVLQRSVALRNPYVDSLSELQVRLLSRLRALPAGIPRDTRSRLAARAADRQRRGGRSTKHPGSREPLEDHVSLLRAAVEPGGTWADIGAGTGAFTLALAELLGPGGRIVAVDRDAGTLAEAMAAVSSRFPQVRIEAIRADFTRPLTGLPALDGLVAANSCSTSCHGIGRPA